MKVRDLIARTLRILGVIASGETPSASEQADMLTALNSMLFSWSTEGLTLFRTTTNAFPLIPSQQVYTIGTGGDFDVPRPVRIKTAYLRYLSGSQPADLPLRILTREEWDALTVKTLDSSMPTDVFIDDDMPLTQIKLWPAPTEAHELVLVYQEPLGGFADINEDVIMPPGYDRAIVYNLAVEAAPEFGKSASNETVLIAQNSLGNVKRINIKPQIATPDYPRGGSSYLFSIITGGRN